MSGDTIRQVLAEDLEALGLDGGYYALQLEPTVRELIVKAIRTAAEAERALMDGNRHAAWRLDARAYRLENEAS